VGKYLLSKLGVLGQFLAVLFDSALKKELEFLLPVALSAVTAAAIDSTLTTGTKKKNFVIGSITTQMKDAQFEIGLSTINLAIELALKSTKAK
jgi:hypothetical protein